MKKVICIGSATKDIFLGLKESRIIENKAEVEAQRLMAFEFGAKIYAQDFYETIGGSAVNVAAGLAKAGIRSFVFSRVGKDEKGKQVIKGLSRLKIKKNYIQQAGGIKTAVSVVISDRKHQDHVIFRTGDSVDNFNLEKSLKKFREKIDWVYMGSQKNDWLKRTERIIKFTQDKKAKLAYNPSSWQISKEAVKLIGFFDKLEILFLNRDEALELIQKVEGEVTDKPKALIVQLLNYGVKTVVLTDGANGAYVGDKKSIMHTPILPGRVIETVGAGDALVSGFLASFIETGNCKNALSWGVTNSAGVLSKIGGADGLLNKKELKRKSEDIKDKIKII